MNRMDLNISVLIIFLSFFVIALLVLFVVKK